MHTWVSATSFSVGYSLARSIVSAVFEEIHIYIIHTNYIIIKNVLHSSLTIYHSLAKDNHGVTLFTLAEG